MNGYSKEILDEAIFSINSTLNKSEKALLKLKENSVQYKMTFDYINAYKICLLVLRKELENDKSLLENGYSKDELEKTIQNIEIIRNKVEKILPKFKEGTAQYTLASRRIKAFTLAIDLISEEI